MKSRNYCVAFIVLMFVLACFHTPVLAQDIAKVSGGASTIRFDIGPSYSAATVSISTPDERVIRKEFLSGAAVEMSLADAKGERYGDGTYTYEIRIAPIFSANNG